MPFAGYLLQVWPYVYLVAFSKSYVNAWQAVEVLSIKQHQVIFVFVANVDLIYRYRGVAFHNAYSVTAVGMLGSVGMLSQPVTRMDKHCLL